MSKSGNKLALGALMAGVAGFAAGILSAPKSGKETRKDIKNAATKALTESEKKLKLLHSELNDLVKKAENEAKKLKGQASNELTQKAKIAKDAKDKAKQLLTALHEGGADSKELDKAVKEIKAAKDHLKKFLKS